MAFTAQTTSSIADFFTKLDAFLSANGWTTHLATGSGEFAADKNPSGSTWITMACQWDTGTPQHAGIYQWHGQSYDTTGVTGTVPYDQTNDSGNGAASTNNTTISGNRRVNLGTSGPEAFWCFEDTNYFHVVIRRDTNVYEHFGAGLLTKYNDWVGGEYCYGQAPDATFNTNTAVRASSSYLLDGLSADQSPGYTNMEERCATMHIDGMAEQSLAGEIWGVVMGNQGAGNLGTDRAGNDRIHVAGGFRAGLFPSLYGQFAGTLQRGLVPLCPIVCSYWDRTADEVYGPLGIMPDTRAINLKNYASEQDIVVGSDTWTVFPVLRRTETTSSAGDTGYQGIAYKQVT